MVGNRERREPKRWERLPPLAIAGPLALAIYLLLNLTPDKQYALAVGVLVFLVTYIAPMIQTYYARKQTQYAHQMDQRDAYRFERERARGGKKAATPPDAVLTPPQ